MGMIANSYIKSKEINSVLKEAFQETPTYKLYSVGHSLGAAVAALLCIQWRKNKMYMKQNPQCICFAPPPCISKTYTIKGEEFISSFINEDDVVPRCSADCVHLFAEHVCTGPWTKKGTRLGSAVSMTSWKISIASELQSCTSRIMRSTSPQRWFQPTTLFLERCIIWVTDWARMKCMRNMRTRSCRCIMYVGSSGEWVV